MKQYRYTGTTVMRFSILHNSRIMDCCAEPGKCLALPSENIAVKSYVTKGIFVDTDTPVSVSEEAAVSVENNNLNTRSVDEENASDEMVDFKVTKKYYYKHKTELDAK